MAEVNKDLVQYAAALVECLAQWDPQTNAENDHSKASKTAFVDALTEIAALPSDSMSMEVRRLLVVSTSVDSRRDHLDHVIEALESRDILLKCKAANAIGSICMSRVAGQRLLDLFGESILLQLQRMMSCKNEWAQGDACFVLGWMVVLADEKMLEAISKLVPIVLRIVERSLCRSHDSRESSASTTHVEISQNRAQPTATALHERLSNIRIYSLVFLLNLCQRNNAQLLENSMAKVIECLHNLLQELMLASSGSNSSTAATTEETKRDTSSATAQVDERVLSASAEVAELLQLWITLVSLLADQLPGVTRLMAKRRMLPLLVKLSRLIAEEVPRELCFQDQDKLLLQERSSILVERVRIRLRIMMNYTLATNGTFEAEKLRLLELNEDIEKEILNGGKLVMVGKDAQTAVLCSKDKTFHVVKEDTSNLRLLTRFHNWPNPTTKDTNKENTRSSGSIPITVESSATSHFLLVPKKPDPLAVRQLLMETPFDTSEAVRSPTAKRPRLDSETTKKPALYTTQDLVLQLQISELELKRILDQLHAFEYDGHWRILAPQFQRRVFGDMLDAVIENDWELFSENGLAISDFVNVLQVDQHQELAIRQCCRIYGHALDSDSERVLLDDKKVALFYAEQIFREAPEVPLTANVASKAKSTKSKSEERAAIGLTSFGEGISSVREWPCDVFMEKWQLRVPERIVVNSAMLQGLAFERQEPNKSNTTLVFLPERELPTEPAARFETLFQLQEKWSLAQLKPYIQSLVGSGMTQAALLLKHTRTSRQKGTSDKLYSRR